MNDGYSDSWAARIAPKIGVCREDDPVFAVRPYKDFLVACSVHSVCADMDRVMSCGQKQAGQARRQCIVDKKSQAERGRGNSRSIAEAAAKCRHSRMSSV
jgi:hypothetical protein